MGSLNFRWSRWLLSVAALIGGVALVGGAVWFASAQDSNDTNVVDATSNTPQADPVEANATPMAQRIATIAVLNKRNSQVREFQMKPGDSLKVADDLILRLRACDTTAPWEHDPATGAFVQVDFMRSKNNWNRIFSGWLYKEHPALNVVQHPVYDVWVKACKMSHGEPADEHTLVNADTAAGDALQASKAKKLGSEADAPSPAKPKSAATDAASAETTPPTPAVPPEEQVPDTSALDNSAQ